MSKSTVALAESRTRARTEEERLGIAAKFFRGLGDPVRLNIVELLLERERNVTQLVEELGVAQSRISNHLACLRWCGYVSSRKEGRNVYYAVTDADVREILALAQSIIARNAEHILACTRI